MKNKRSNPYDPRQVAEKHNIPLEEAEERVRSLKSRVSGSLDSFIKRHGKEEGLRRYEEFCKKSSHTEGSFKEKYGDDWERHWLEYLGKKDSTSLEFHLEKYGKKEGPRKYLERLEKIKPGLQALVDRHGSEEGLKIFNEANNSRSYLCSTDGLADSFGIEKAISIQSSKGMKGEKNPMFGRSSPEGSGNGWSGWYKGHYFRSILELSYMKYLDDNNILYSSAERSEYSVSYILNGTARNYYPDFVVNGDIIEIKPKKLLESIENKAKFLAAKKKYGDRFHVLTEEDFERIPDISKMIDSGEVKLIERYRTKYNEDRENRE